MVSLRPEHDGVTSGSPHGTPQDVCFLPCALAALLVEELLVGAGVACMNIKWPGPPKVVGSSFGANSLTRVC